MKNTFVSKTDLAQAYFPYIDYRSARHKLMHVIDSDKTLKAELEESGLQRLSHEFSPAQVDIIVRRLGNPFKS